MAKGLGRSMIPIMSEHAPKKPKFRRTIDPAEISPAEIQVPAPGPGKPPKVRGGGKPVTPFMAAFQRKFHALRGGRNQEEVAREIGFSHSTISKWKDGTSSSLDAEIALKIARYFQVPVEYLIDPQQKTPAPQAPLGSMEQAILTLANTFGLEETFDWIREGIARRDAQAKSGVGYGRPVGGNERASARAQEPGGQDEPSDDPDD